MSAALDLGCGKEIRNPFNAESVFGIDIIEQNLPNYAVANLFRDPIPFPDNSFDFVTAYDFIEHVPRQAFDMEKSRIPFVELMDEIYRVLKPGGIFFSDTPCIPEDLTREGATRDLHLVFADPTHVNIISLYTYKFYFCAPHCWAKAYGFKGSFDLVHQAYRGMNLMSTLKKGPVS